ncbi:hypothetical protein TOPH_08111 [Tolypocladium ophioglossoides CBS 100239]|uniref:Uncharacterized protein n=1 Tax=Tolypocladium ophioglossoides (strain CBS 100239) TaxID=1163406 RepID=A0A0L0MZE1_TOLOC|nr:hypothetical protein TOPH_08111 [Tolypocladium ophioglossoides CBS 100239]
MGYTGALSGRYIRPHLTSLSVRRRGTQEPLLASSFQGLMIRACSLALLTPQSLGLLTR